MTAIISLIEFNNTFFCFFIQSFSIVYSWKGLLKSLFLFFSFLACFTAYSLILKNSTIFWIVQSPRERVSICIFLSLEQSVTFSFIESTNHWQLLQLLFSINWGSENAMDKTFLNFVVTSLIFLLPIDNVLSDHYTVQEEQSNISTDWFTISFAVTSNISSVSIASFSFSCWVSTLSFSFFSKVLCFYNENINFCPSNIS